MAVDQVKRFSLLVVDTTILVTFHENSHVQRYECVSGETTPIFKQYCVSVLCVHPAFHSAFQRDCFQQL